MALNFSLEFHTFLWDFDKQKFLMLKLLGAKSYIRCLFFSAASTVFELNFSAGEKVYWSSTHVCLTHCVERERIDTKFKKEAISHGMILLCELFYVVRK